MADQHEISCACGQMRLALTGNPIVSVACCCTSCREAATRLQALEGAPQILTNHGTISFVMYRKDRVQFLAGTKSLRAFRLLPNSPSKRVIATCCNTSVYLEFKGGHWLSLYGGMWPDGTMPPTTMRTMAADMPDGATLPDDIPNAKKHSISFFAKLLGAWVAMGFRSPKMPDVAEIKL